MADYAPGTQRGNSTTTSPVKQQQQEQQKQQQQQEQQQQHGRLSLSPRQEPHVEKGGNEHPKVSEEKGWGRTQVL